MDLIDYEPPILHRRLPGTRPRGIRTQVFLCVPLDRDGSYFLRESLHIPVYTSGSPDNPRENLFTPYSVPRGFPRQ